MKLTKSQLKQTIREEVTIALGANENVDAFAVVSPDGKVFRVKKSSEKVDNDPQKAINLVANQTPPAHRFGDFRVYEYDQYGGGVGKEPILVGKPTLETLYEENLTESQLKDVIKEALDEIFGLEIPIGKKQEETPQPTDVLNNIRDMWPAQDSGDREKIQALEDIYRFLDKALVGTHQQPGLVHLKEKNESI